MSNWKKISDEPPPRKKYVLVAWDDTAPKGFRNTVCHNSMMMDVPDQYGVCDLPLDFDWYDATEESCQWDPHEMPTHWMPLPDPPGAAGPGELR